MQWFWSEGSDEARVVETNDPLGLQSVAVAIADALVPGFTGATTRARSLSLMFGGVCLFGGVAAEQQRTYFDRFERLLVYGVVVRGTTHAQWLSLRGARFAVHRRRKLGRRGHADLTAPLGRVAAGSLWAYRRLAGQLGLLTLHTPAGIGWLTDAGAKLAEAAIDRSDIWPRYLRRALERGRVRPHVMRHMTLDRRPHKRERQVIAAALRTHLSPADPLPLRALATLSGPEPPGVLSHRQRTLWDAALRVGDLVRDIEGPFRAHIGAPSPPGLRDHDRLRRRLEAIHRTLDAPGLLPGAPSLDILVQLDEALSRDGAIEALEAHHRALMARKGYPPWSAPRPPRAGAAWSATDPDDDEDRPDDEDFDRQLRDAPDGLPRTPAHDRLRALRQMVADCRPESLE